MATMFVNSYCSVCLSKRHFLLFLQHRKIAESEKARNNFCLNESQKVFLLSAQCVIALYSLRNVAILLVNARKPLKPYCFELAQNSVSFLIWNLFFFDCF